MGELIFTKKTNLFIGWQTPCQTHVIIIYIKLHPIYYLFKLNYLASKTKKEATTIKVIASQDFF